MTFSEFGRTLDENGSQGTDHGASAPLFLFGKGLTPGLYGTPNPLTRDDDFDRSGDPAFTTDYRQVYATLLERWFGLSPSAVDAFFPRTFNRMGFLSGTSTSTPDIAGPRPQPVGRAQPCAIGRRRHVWNGRVGPRPRRPVRRSRSAHRRSRERHVRRRAPSGPARRVGPAVRPLPSPPRHRYGVHYPRRNGGAMSGLTPSPSPSTLQ